MEAWRTLMSLQDEGKVRLIGISNAYDVNLLHALSRERKVQVVQNRWYQGNEWDRLVHTYCKHNDVMYQSFWTLSGSPSLLSHPQLRALAAAANCTPEQAVFKLAQLEGVTPLSGTTSIIHMEQDMAVDSIQFPPEESEKSLSAIRQILSG
ncbi:hypothetical protein H0H81_001915 [Sphagnurus paluster]|uniref:NADP-dependent oxidoreductase domain-containing protein n=1 Tax=Sphagnurus paluster TaxID=117069 RepID=A0A9P7GGW7_9AGAR|nr:hypothetical protein H0H81_001915 [Sphagnurus paluster]